MSAHDLAPAFAYVGGALGFAMSVPQLRRIRRSAPQEIQGVAFTTWAYIATCCLCYLVYGFKAAPEMIAANLVNVAAGTFVCWQLHRVRGDVLGRWIVLLVVTAGFCAVAPVAAIGWLGTVYALLQRHPQIVSSWRFRRCASHDRLPSGVSLLSWWLSMTCTTMWLVYGILADDGIVVACNVALVAQSAVIIALESRPDRALTATSQVGAAA